MKSSNPYNIGFTPVFLDEKESADFINEQPDLFPTFYEWFGDNLKRHSTMILKMKSYIINNWEKIDNWDGINIQFDDLVYGKKHKVKFDKEKGYETVVDSLFDKMNRNIVEIEYLNFVFDYTDFDLSVEINDKDNWKFLDDSEIIEIALFIENKLNNNE